VPTLPKKKCAASDTHSDDDSHTFSIIVIEKDTASLIKELQ